MHIITNSNNTINPQNINISTNSPTNTDINSYKNATGFIPYNMTNDYMFRFVLQKNSHVLKGLVCSLLHLSPNKISSITITNPLSLGNDFDNNTISLNICITLHNNTLITLEMQMANQLHWKEHALHYLCRSYEHIYSKQEYHTKFPVIHVAFVNFTPFSESPEFFSTYQLSNKKNYLLYTDNFMLHLMDFTHIELATEDDRQHLLDDWAKLFTAVSWEEIILLSKKNFCFSEAAQTLFELNSNETLCLKCKSRQSYSQHEDTIHKMVETLTHELATLNDENISLKARIAELEAMAKQNR
ncbi:MAG: PD-(D/E)XK nuclease family transposase [Lachnospiraceae bacterium]|nr:PD-(D/E)XK nuclease family transposase [Lachnospiraceae bacterium]